MKLQINNQIDRTKWQKLCDSSAYGSPFQTPEFFKFFNSVYGLSADVFAVEENHKIICLAIVTVQKEHGFKAWFSRRGIIYGGFLAGDNGETLEFLLIGMSKFYQKKLIYLEIRNYFDYSKYARQLTHAGFRFIPWLNFQLHVSSVEAMQKTMSKSRLRHIKKAVNYGATWKAADKLEDISAFYTILKDLYKNKIKKPLFPLDFFIAFFKANVGKFLLVYYEDKVIGGIMCPVFNNKTIYEYYVCGLDQDYKNQYPSVMATWAAMEYAAQNNIKVFDFMGAGSPDEAYGVREFKARFGGKEVEHGRYLKILNPVLYQVGVWGLQLLSKMK